ncbi:FHA domain-containing protein [Anaerotruncus colihominis]|uniref:FHA domain-containing protein n=1 Tax=Anaerotruncus colihominis TaxID=169435 RepID=UPI00189C18E5|nr:FHA domain-containing protein [Anaerotruncus colihominis]
MKTMSRTNMAQCQMGHLFDTRMHGNKCPYCGRVVGRPEKREPLPTIEELEDELLYLPIEPVCGWLACISGPRTGQSFTLHAGKNFIGRADDMDVQILGDMGVARRNHASIAYDPLNRQFVLVPGDSEKLVYMNNQSVYEPVRLLDMSSIRLGDTVLVFRPLCGDHFAWEEL